MKRMTALVIAAALLVAGAMSCFAAKPSAESVSVQSVTAEEYYAAKSAETGIDYDIAAEESAMTAVPGISVVYKKYTQTFSHPKNSLYKASIGGYFALVGCGNYYEIKECCRAFTELAPSSAKGRWQQDAVFYADACASSRTLIGGGKFRRADSKIYLNNSPYILEDDLNMHVAVTALRLK